jgi:hypothetical protein
MRACPRRDARTREGGDATHVHGRTDILCDDDTYDDEYDDDDTYDDDDDA